MIAKPAFIIAAAGSGSGKTTLALGIMAALTRRGMRVQPFKCGPDFIDPSLHRFITGRTSYNLDLNMMGPACCRETFARHGSQADVCVVEGVMGLYDGGPASTAALAKALGIPVVLVIDARAMAESAAAVADGFSRFDPDIEIGGVIFNRIGSARHQSLIQAAMRDSCPVSLLGFVGRNDRFAIAERHLGLHMGDESPLDRAAVEELAACVETDLRLDLLLTDSGARLEEVPENTEAMIRPGRPVRLGCAMDEAFCFYYRQNLQSLERAGFTVVPFSPIHERDLPRGVEMIYLGGGYPELHAAQLSDNREMRAAVKAFVRTGKPVYAECGGFMYLCESLTTVDGERYDMSGIFPFRTVMGRRLRRLGYRRVTLLRDCLIGRRGAVVHGHEFHYSAIENEAAPGKNIMNPSCLYLLDNNSQEGYSVGSALGSYVHLHFGCDMTVPNHWYRLVTERDR